MSKPPIKIRKKFTLVQKKLKTPPLKNFFKKLFFRKSQIAEKHNEENETLIEKIKNHKNEGIIKNFEVFSNKTLEDIMIPRSDIISISIESSKEDICKNIVQHGHTRTLIYQEKLDNIMGFIHIKDIFEVIALAKKFNLKKLLRKHIVAPHSMKLVDLLAQMQITRTHIAIIVDEYGGTDGLVTIEDIIEEIVGRIDDEHDEEISENIPKILKPGVLVTNARVEINEIERIIGFKLKNEEDEFDTIGGLVMSVAGCVPEKGEIIVLDDNFAAEIVESTPRTIKKIKLTYPLSNH